MELSIEVVIFFLLLIDSIGANILSWFGEGWYKKHFRTLSRIIPATKSWTAMYLFMVVLLGIILYRFGAFGGI